MADLRQAAQQALEAMEVLDAPPSGAVNHYELDRRKQALRAALAQEEQEPVLVVVQEPDYMSRGHFHEGSKPFIDPTEVWKLPIGTKLYTHPPRSDTEQMLDAAYQSACDIINEQDKKLVELEALNAELLGALRDIGEYRGEGPPYTTPWQDVVRNLGEIARAAIAKAEEQQ